MHTVFINTTKNIIGGHMDVLGIEREFKKLTYLDCPLSAWHNEENGYEKCAAKLGELIDSHKEITNNFNMIIYVDLLEIPEYHQLVFSRADVVAQSAGYEVLRNMLTRFFASTIYDKLEELGRRPNGKLMLLLEQNQRKNDDAGRNLDSGTVKSLREGVKESAVLQFLGLPNKEELAEHVRSNPAEQLEPLLKAELEKNRNRLKLIEPQTLYQENLQIFCDSLTKDGVVFEKACQELSEAVSHLYDADCNTKMVVSEFYTDRRSAHTNKEIDTKRNLLVQIFLHDCIAKETLFREDGKTAKVVPILTDEKWQKLCRLLAQKKSSYEQKENELSRLGESYTKLGLAPTLYKINSEKFGLDDGGNLNKAYEQKEKPAKKKKKSKDAEVVLEEKETDTTWFKTEEYKPFDAEGHAYTDDTDEILSADEYCERATQLANHHHGFLNKLSLHVSRTMSNYAGRSLTNAPAVLRKRSVSVGTESDSGLKNDYKYTDGAKKSDNTPLESILKTSKRAYLTLLIEYLKFNTGRSVAMSTIKEHTEWFINRIRQIEESLKHLRMILGTLVLTLLVAYLPFVLIQWDAITKNIDTLLVAAASIVLPFVLLGVGYAIARVLQKKKMKQAWLELIDRSNEAIEANKNAVKAYDQMLTMHIPSLRWVYEYVLDVDFYHECCVIADAKLKHHRDHLAECIETTGNILEDLECDDYKTSIGGKPFELDYTRAFCEGKNKDFYSIIDEELLKTIYTQGGAA